MKWESLASVLLPVLLSVFGLLYASLPSYSGTLFLSGLDSTVTIARDNYGVPTITAETEGDVYFAQGFVHAQDRLWAMDIFRRTALGRLSELLGASSLEIDLFAHNLNLPTVAKRAVSALPQRYSALLERYAAGVNAYVKRATALPPEYYFSWTVFEPWQPLHSVACLQLMGVKWGYEFLRHSLRAAAGEAVAKMLLPTDFPEDLTTYIVDDGDLPAELRRKLDLSVSESQSKDNFPSDSKGSPPQQVRPSSAEFPSSVPSSESSATTHSGGSNSWVVSGRFTKSGFPLIANDTHMKQTIPCFWYLIRMKVRQNTVTGTSAAGLPSVFAGRNDDIAWAITALEGDTVDFYRETRSPASHSAYLYHSEYIPFTVRHAHISVRGETVPLDVEFEESVHGPILRKYSYGAHFFDTKYVDGSGEQAIAVRWSLAHVAEDRSVEAILRMATARNAQELRDSLKLVSCCAMSVVFATKKDIGFQATGKIPLIRHPMANSVMEGSEADNEWSEFIPFDSLPYVLNPSKGFIVAANNAPAHNYAFRQELGTDFLRYRATRITQLIESQIASGRPFTVEDMAAMQRDEYSLVGEWLLPSLLSYADSYSTQTRSYRLLSQWDFRMSRDSVPATLFQVFLSRFMSTIVSDEVATEAARRSLLDAPAFLDFMLVTYGRKGEGRERWCDNVQTAGKIETCAEVVSGILLDLDKEKVRPWGDCHQVSLDHFPFSNSTVLRAFLHQMVSVGGAHDTVHAQDFSRSDFRSTSGPNMRLVADMAGSGFWAIETGQSGNFLSSHYADMTKRFHYGEVGEWTLAEAARSSEMTLQAE